MLARRRAAQLTIILAERPRTVDSELVEKLEDDDGEGWLRAGFPSGIADLS